jgi:hypothetical protein
VSGFRGIDDTFYATYLSSREMLNEIYSSPEFGTYDKAIQHLITRALQGMSTPPTWNYVNKEVTCNQFDMLLNTYNNDPVLRTMYVEYLLQSTISLDISPEDLGLYLKTAEFKELSITIQEKLIKAYPHITDM